MQIKRIAITLISLCCLGTTHADVTFTFDYTEASGTGLHRYPELQRLIETAAQELGTAIVDEGDIRIRVINYSPGEDRLAGYLPTLDYLRPHPSAANAYLFPVQSKILHDGAHSGKWEALLIFNMAELSSGGYSDEKLKILVKHELTHALGFSSLLDEACDRVVDDQWHALSRCFLVKMAELTGRNSQRQKARFIEENAAVIALWKEQFVELAAEEDDNQASCEAEASAAVYEDMLDFEMRLLKLTLQS